MNHELDARTLSRRGRHPEIARYLAGPLLHVGEAVVPVAREGLRLVGNLESLSAILDPQGGLPGVEVQRHLDQGSLAAVAGHRGVQTLGATGQGPPALRPLPGPAAAPARR